MKKDGYNYSVCLYMLLEYIYYIDIHYLYQLIALNKNVVNKQSRRIFTK